VFYIILFSALAVLLVVAGSVAISRQRRRLREEESREGRTKQEKRNRKAKRTQSRHDRRQRK
jgi:hypothetical protein